MWEATPRLLRLPSPPSSPSQPSVCRQTWRPSSRAWPCRCRWRLSWLGRGKHLSSIPPGKRRSTLCGYLAGWLVLRFQRSNGQIPGYQARTSPPPRQRIAYPVQALGGSGKAFGCFLSSRGSMAIQASVTRAESDWRQLLPRGQSGSFVPDKLALRVRAGVIIWFHVPISPVLSFTIRRPINAIECELIKL
jgi:hypothetical protein